MYSSKDAANTPYPTQWALNPTAYQNVDSSEVDWAALAQQWIAMKEAAAIISVPPPPSIKPDTEKGEAPMEVENIDNSTDGVSNNAEWNSNTDSWNENWNQWGWGWPGSGPVEPKMGSDTNIPMQPMMDNYPITTENAAPPISGYTSATVPAPTFQHGYWTAPQPERTSRSGSRSRDKRSKSKTREYKSSRSTRPQRDKPPIIPPVIEPIVPPTPMLMPTIDAAKRRQLPAWIREGLEKMEREKQRAIEKEQEKKALEEAEKEKKRLEEEELQRLKAEAGAEPILPPKSKFESDSENEEMEQNIVKDETVASENVKEEPEDVAEETQEESSLVKRSKEEIMEEVMLAVRRSLTEILLDVTDHEIHTVSQEELSRYTAAQASRINAMKASKSKALADIASGLGLGAYESSSGESGDEDERKELSDQQLQEIIRRKRQDFERTARDIEIEVRRAENKDTEEPTTPVSTTPERPRKIRSSATPPPMDGDTSSKLSGRRISKDRRSSQKSVDKADGFKKLDVIPEEKAIKPNRWDRTPSPQARNTSKTNNKANSPTTSDTEKDSSSSGSDSSSESEPEVKLETKSSKERKRRSSSSSEPQKKSKKVKSKKESSQRNEKIYKSKVPDKHEKSEPKPKRRDDYRSSRSSRDYDRVKYRDESDDDRARKRARRSRSHSYESRSGRKRISRDRSEERSRRRDKDKRLYEREHERSNREMERAVRDQDRAGRDHDRHDKYDRGRDRDRRRSRSRSRYRR